MVSTRPPASKSSCPFNNPLVTVPKAPITIGTIVTFMFHSFFQFSSKFEVLILLFTFFRFYSAVSQNSKVHNFANSLFFFYGFLLGLVIWPRLGDPFVCQCPIGVYVSFSRTAVGLWTYHLFVWSNLNFLHISQWITLPTHSCLVSYSFRADFLHSFIMWVIVLSRSPHNLHLLFCCVLSILALMWLVLMALFCAAIRKGSVSLSKFPFLSHVQVFWCEILFISRLKRPELFFFQFLFPIYCNSVVHHVVSIVSDGCVTRRIYFYPKTGR